MSASYSFEVESRIFKPFPHTGIKKALRIYIITLTEMHLVKDGASLSEFCPLFSLI